MNKWKEFLLKDYEVETIRNVIEIARPEGNKHIYGDIIGYKIRKKPDKHQEE